MNESVRKADGLTQESYQRLLKQLQDTEQRIDLQQKDMIESVRAEFKRIVAALDSSEVIKEVQAKFLLKLERM